MVLFCIFQLCCCKSIKMKLETSPAPTNSKSTVDSYVSNGISRRSVSILQKIESGIPDGILEEHVVKALRRSLLELREKARKKDLTISKEIREEMKRKRRREFRERWMTLLEMTVFGVVLLLYSIVVACAARAYAS
jgi:hypothetical protein